MTEEIPCFKIPVTICLSEAYSKYACYEFGYKYFQLKKAIYDIDRFNSIYNECLEKAKLAYETQNIPKLHINHQHIYNSNSNNDEANSLQHMILTIFPSSFMIMTTQMGSFIIIAYSWKEFLLCDPSSLYSICGTSEYLIDYINTKYSNVEEIKCFHMLK